MIRQRRNTAAPLSAASLPLLGSAHRDTLYSAHSSPLFLIHPPQFTRCSPTLWSNSPPSTSRRSPRMPPSPHRLTWRAWAREGAKIVTEMKNGRWSDGMRSYQCRHRCNFSDVRCLPLCDLYRVNPYPASVDHPLLHGSDGLHLEYELTVSRQRNHPSR